MGMNLEKIYRGKLRQLLGTAYHLIPGKDPLLKVIRNHWQLPESAYRWIRYRGVFTVDVNGDSFQLRSDGEHTESSIFWGNLDGALEGVSFRLWSEIVKDANTIFDVGANTGIYSLIAKSVNPAARVFGFEPIERICRKFESNKNLNDFDIECLQLAVSDKDGTAVIFDPGGHVYSVTLNENHNPPGVQFKETVVKTARLDSFMKERHLGKVDLIKLDIEGHEPEALLGMGSFLSESRPALLVEITTDEKAKQIEKVLSGLDYLYFDIDEKNEPKHAKHLRKSSKWNWLICSEKVAKRLKLLS